jgi:hypothetical protein
MSDGFGVEPEALHQYGDALAAKVDHAVEISDLVAKADVGDTSWGVVGLFVKADYTAMLNDLRDLLEAMRGGLQSGAIKAHASAAAYESAEDDIVSSLLDAAEQL